MLEEQHHHHPRRRRGTDQSECAEEATGVVAGLLVVSDSSPASSCRSVAEESHHQVESPSRRLAESNDSLLRGMEEAEEDEEEAHSARLSAWAVFLTLTMSVVGTGLLSLPAAFSCLGVAGGLGTLALVSLAMFASGDFLLRSYLASPSSADSYEGLVVHSCRVAGWEHRAGKAKVVVSLVNCIGLFGGCCAYIAIGKDLFPALRQRVDASGEHRWWLDTEIVTLALVGFVSFPLCLMRNLSSLRYSSMFGFCFSIYTILVISGRGFEKLLQGNAAWDNWTRSECPGKSAWTSFVSAVSIFNFSFVFHFNILPLYRTLPRVQRNLSTMRKVLTGTSLACFILYGSIGVGGFALFGAQVKENILGNFSKDDDVINLARFAICACCFLCLPLLEHPLRGTVLSLLRCRNNDRSRLFASLGLLSAQYFVALIAPGIKVLFQMTGGSAVVGFCYVFPICFALVITGRSKTDIHTSLLGGVSSGASDIAVHESNLSDEVFFHREHSAIADSALRQVVERDIMLTPFEKLLCGFMLLFFPLCGAWSLFVH